MGQIVPPDKIDYILESARLAPSSSGLQPYRIIEISNRDKLQEIKENVFKDFPFNQGQINDCSHLLVWASWDNYTPERIRKTLVNASRLRGLSDQSSEDYQKRLWALNPKVMNGIKTIVQNKHTFHSVWLWQQQPSYRLMQRQWKDLILTKWTKFLDLKS